MYLDFYLNTNEHILQDKNLIERNREWEAIRAESGMQKDNCSIFEVLRNDCCGSINYDLTVAFGGKKKS